MAASNTRFTQNSLGQSKNPIDSDHGIYRSSGDANSSRCSAARRRRGRLQPVRSRWASCRPSGSWVRILPRPRANGPQLLCSGCATSAG
jgi:hypothetical protein